MFTTFWNAVCKETTVLVKTKVNNNIILSFSITYSIITAFFLVFTRINVENEACLMALETVTQMLVILRCCNVSTGTTEEVYQMLCHRDEYLTNAILIE